MSTKRKLLPVSSVLLISLVFLGASIATATTSTANVYSLTVHMGSNPDPISELKYDDGVIWKIRQVCWFVWGVGWLYRVDFTVELRTAWYSGTPPSINDVTKVGFEVDEAACRSYPNPYLWPADWDFHALRWSDSAFMVNWYRYYVSTVDETFETTSSLSAIVNIQTSGGQWRFRCKFRMGATAAHPWYILPGHVYIDAIIGHVTYS